MASQTKPDDPTEHASRVLTHRYRLALGTIAALAIIGQILIHIALSGQASDSHTINIAGRQRMLSQRLTKAALAIEGETDASRRAQRLQELREALSLWVRSHHGLQSEDPDQSLYPNNSDSVRALFAELEPQFRAMESTLATLAADEQLEPAQVSGVVEQILAVEQLFLRQMNAIVYQYARDARARVSALQRLELALAAFTLLVLFLEAQFIFRPAVARVRQTLNQLVIAKDELSRTNDQLVQVNVELDDALRKALDGILPICAGCKSIRDDAGEWKRIESYLHTRTGADFSHGLCPDCVKTLYPDLDLDDEPS